MPSSCYLLGAVWNDSEPKNQLPRFIEQGIWENGHEEQFTGRVNEIPVGATVFAKASYFHNGLREPMLDIRAKGIVTANVQNGHDLTVTWDSAFEPYKLTESELPGIGRYRNTVERVTEPTHLARFLEGVLPPKDERKPLPSFPRNQILYGPPGTGKTYHTVAKAVALLSGTSDEDIAAQYPPEKRGELRQRFEDYRQAQRIEFVTFHQAFSYEDFVEGIKPLAPEKDAEGEPSTATAKPVQYAVEKGVFRRICESATAAANTAAAPILPAFDTLYDDFVAQLAERMESTKGSLTFFSKTSVPITLTGISLDNPLKRLTFLHANSGQQDHHIDKTWIKKLYDKYQSIDQVQHLTNDITKAVGGSNATLMWVVFNELKQYEAAWVAQERAKQQTTPPPPFVLIIDEINRGNVANIFGELITLLEDDKRAGGAEALTVTLPYSKEKFAVPSNLYVLGTMNTADRSVEALDTALRRRFSFTEMLPRPELLPVDVEGINLRELLIAVNARLEQLLDHDHCLGHALLIHVKTLDQLREAFRRSILPLLQEYFFGDWGKIGLVLGAAFITQVNKKAGATGYKLLSFGSYSTGELSEKPVYRLTDIQQVPAQAFQAIYAV
jgi:5-methylcytosine-specific restriction endonuclease McrBC GTP-binding regulatory subunit McrB